MKPNRKIAESAAAEQVTVLLIEDSMEDGAIITRALIEGELFYSFKIIREYTLKQGLEFLRNNAVGIVLLDLGLPDARGLKAITEIHAAFPDVPIVVISGHATPEKVHLALLGGAQEFLIKGESESIIRQSIYQAIARKKIELAYQKGERL